MFEARILSGCWDEGTIELIGMPKDFILSARTLVVLEKEEAESFDFKKWQIMKCECVPLGQIWINPNEQALTEASDEDN